MQKDPHYKEVEKSSNYFLGMCKVCVRQQQIIFDWGSWWLPPLTVFYSFTCISLNLVI